MATITFDEIPKDIEAKSSGGYSGYDVDDRAYDLLYVSNISSGTMAAPYLVGPITAKTDTVLTIDTSIYNTATYDANKNKHVIDLKDIVNVGIGKATASSIDWFNGNWPFHHSVDGPTNYYFFVVKDKVAQSNGLLGYYMQVKMRLSPGASKKTELFAVGSEVFISSK